MKVNAQGPSPASGSPERPLPLSWFPLSSPGAGGEKTVFRSQRGLTLVEIAVILVILTILAIALVPTMGNLLAVTRTKGASEEVAMAIRRARQLAITKAVNHCVNFPGGNQYQIWEGSCGGTSVEGPVTLSQGATVSGTPSFTFDPIGKTAVGAVIVSIADSSVCPTTVVVTAVGGVRVPPPASPPCP